MFLSISANWVFPVDVETYLGILRARLIVIGAAVGLFDSCSLKKCPNVAQNRGGIPNIVVSSIFNDDVCSYVVDS